MSPMVFYRALAKVEKEFTWRNSQVWFGCWVGLRSNDNVQTTKCPSVGLIKMFQTCTSQCMLDFPMVFRFFFYWNTGSHEKWSKRSRVLALWRKRSRGMLCHKGQVHDETIRSVWHSSSNDWVQLDLLHSLTGNVHIWNSEQYSFLLFLFFLRTNPFCWCSGNTLSTIHCSHRWMSTPIITKLLVNQKRKPFINPQNSQMYSGCTLVGSKRVLTSCFLVCHMTY